jgi:hypothetical protein
MSQEEAHARFEGVRRRDRIKNDWAKENGWTMLRLTDAATIEEELTSALGLRGLPVPISRSP